MRCRSASRHNAAAPDCYSIAWPESATLITINEEYDMTQTTAITPYGSLNNADGNNDLLDTLLAKGPKNDAALARALEVAPPVISKIRHGRLPIGASLLIRMHEVLDVSIRELKRIARAEVAA